MGRSGSGEKTPSCPAFKDVKMIYPLDIQENVKKKKTGKAKPPTSNSNEEEKLTEMMIVKAIPANFSGGFHQDNKESFNIRCLQDMLEESQSDTSCSFYSHHDCNEESYYERTLDGKNYWTFEYELTSPAFSRVAFATITISNGRYYTLVVGANERRWSRVRDKLKVVADSFRMIDI